MLRVAGTGGKHVENVPDRDAQSAKARLTRALAGHKGDPGKIGSACSSRT
jgi:hypothetical protein